VLVVDEGCLNGRWMLSMVLSFPAANGDPAMFPNAGRVVIDRSPNRHAAFGLGIHRCLGSNLARGSRKSLTSCWPNVMVESSAGSVRRPRTLPLVFGAD